MANIIATASPAVKTVPTAASGLGFNRLIFFDDFKTSSNIDLNQTNGAGFTWWKSSWFGVGAWPSPAADGDISVNASLMRSSGYTADVEYRPRIGTAQRINSSSYIFSKLFSPSSGFYVEVSLKFDPALCLASYTANGWPSIWMSDPIFNQSGPAGVRGVELDLFEAYPQSNGVNNAYFAVHEWDTDGSGGSIHVSNNANYDATSVLSGTNYNVPNKYATLLTPRALGSGTGSIKRYFNDSLLSGQTVTYTSSGQFSNMEDRPWMFFIEGGPNWPAYYDYVAVWGP